MNSLIQDICFGLRALLRSPEFTLVAVLTLAMGIGVLAALALGRLMSGLLFNIAPTDLWTFIAVLTTLSIVAVATCLIPARRATSSSPTEALRIHWPTGF